jgi:hypothetical protein
MEGIVPVTLSPAQEAAARSYLALAEDQRKALITTISQAPFSASVADFARDVYRRSGQESPLVTELVWLFVVLEITRARDEQGASKAAEEFVASVRPLGSKDSTDDFWRQICDEVAQVFANQALGDVAKAHDIVFENPTVFLDARFLTDLRPVFRSDPDATPVAAVIQHTLRISYQNDAGPAAFYVTLTSDDLRRLEKALTRALRKDKTMRKFSDTAELPLFGYEGGD